MGSIFGKHVGGKCCSGGYQLRDDLGTRNSFMEMTYVFGLGIIYLPVVLVMTVVMWPVVVIYKLYNLFAIIIRNFLCCCFC